MNSGLRADRIPGTLAEAERLVAYNKRVLATSRSAQRRDRAERMLANLRPHVLRLQAAARPASTSAPAPADLPIAAAGAARGQDDDLYVVWNGRVR